MLGRARAELTGCLGPNGASVPAAVSAAGPGVFRAEFVPRAVGEHRLNVLVDAAPIPASPFHLKVSYLGDSCDNQTSSDDWGRPRENLFNWLVKRWERDEWTALGKRSWYSYYLLSL